MMTAIKSDAASPISEVAVTDVDNVAIQENMGPPNAVECWDRCISHSTKAVWCIVVWRFTCPARARDSMLEHVKARDAYMGRAIG